MLQVLHQGQHTVDVQQMLAPVVAMTKHGRGEIGAHIRHCTPTSCSLWLSWILEISSSSCHITDEECESQLVAEPEENTGPVPQGWPAHQFLSLGPRRAGRGREWRSSAQGRMGCWCLNSPMPHRGHVGVLVAFMCQSSYTGF